MPSTRVLGLTALTVGALASFFITGCSSADADGAKPFANAADPAGLTDEERAELTALDVDADEAVVDEGDIAAIDDGLAEPDEALPPEGDEEGEDGSLSTLGLERIPLGNESRGRVSKCAKSDPDATPRCICAGSMLNCRVPSNQIGKNRYLPRDWDAYMKANEKLERTPQIIGIGRWELKDNTVMFDGLGGVRGTFTSPCQILGTVEKDGKQVPAPVNDPAKAGKVCAKINYGQIKKMPGDASTRYVYAFSVTLTNGDAAAGWVKLDDVVDKEALLRMGAHSPPRVTKFVRTEYVVRSAKDYGLDPATFRQDQLSGAATWTFLKDKKAEDGSREANDYLLNNGNIVNLAYATPGVGGPATDTLPVGDHTLGFTRARSTKSRPAIVWTNVYDTANKAHKMFFVYGRINDRYGWMAAAAIMKGKVAPASVRGGGGGGGGGPATEDVCQYRSNGAYCDVILGNTGFMCKDGHTVAQPPLTCPPETPKCVGQGRDPNTLACDG